MRKALKISNYRCKGTVLSLPPPSRPWQRSHSPTYHWHYSLVTDENRFQPLHCSLMKRPGSNPTTLIASSSLRCSLDHSSRCMQDANHMLLLLLLRQSHMFTIPVKSGPKFVKLRQLGPVGKHKTPWFFDQVLKKFKLNFIFFHKIYLRVHQFFVSL